MIVVRLGFNCSSTGPHFSAGIDLSMFKDDVVEHETNQSLAEVGVFYSTVKVSAACCSCLEDARFPVVAAVQGGCIGGGIDLITAADIRLCTKDAFF